MMLRNHRICPYCGRESVTLKQKKQGILICCDNCGGIFGWAGDEVEMELKPTLSNLRSMLEGASKMAWQLRKQAELLNDDSLVSFMDELDCILLENSLLLEGWVSLVNGNESER